MRTEIVSRNLAIALTLFVLAVAIPLRADDWKKIGSARAAHKLETDKIVVHEKTEFRQVKLHVENIGIGFKDVKVVFDNDEEQSLPVRAFISAGGETRAFDLKRGPRRISKIYLEYESRPSTVPLGLKQGKVEVFAK